MVPILATEIKLGCKSAAKPAVTGTHDTEACWTQGTPGFMAIAVVRVRAGMLRQQDGTCSRDHMPLPEVILKG